MKRFLLFFLIISVAFISIFVKDNFFNLRTEEGSLIKEQLIKTVSAQSDPSQTKSCSCSSGGCYCEVTFSNFISDGYELTSASIDVDARGDLNSGSEYITVYTDGSNRGNCCTGNCGQCSGSYANCNSYNVTTAASDDSLRVRCDASSAVNYCSTYLDCRVTLSWSEQPSCTPNGESCSLDSDCCSGNCAADYEGGGKYCAPAGQCVHGSGVTTGSDSQTKTDCCYRSSGSCDASVSFNNFISSGCSLDSASLDIDEGGDTNSGSEKILYYVDGNYKKTCQSDQDWGCPIADWSNCWDGDVTSEASDNSLTVLADGQDDADYVGVRATLSYSYSCGTLDYYNDGGCSPNGSYVCDGGDWIDHCTSGEQDCDETGVDCGGSDCPSCVNPPSVETNNASGIQETQATLNGNLTDMGGASSCNVWFEWDQDGVPYDNETTHRIKSSTGPFDETITVSPNTTYYFRAVAENPGGIVYGSDKSFTTSVTNNPPDAPTNPSPADGATGVSTSPTLSVDVSDPDGDSMDVTFYNASNDSVIGTDNGVNSGGTASVTWSGLSNNTTYSWYAVADDGTDSTQSNTWSFTTSAPGAGGGDVRGWAWSENIGWISFNSTSGGGSVDYGVNIETDGNLTGYAWSENIGWIHFDPSSPYPTAPNYSAQIDLGNLELSGWARASATDGGWDGWIKLRGSGYGVWLDSSVSPAEFKGWAWGGNDSNDEAVVGWISFNCSNQGICGTSDYKVITSFSINQPPTAANLNDPDLAETYCRIAPGVGHLGFEWEYDDPDGDPETQYDFQIATDSNFNNLVVNSTCDSSTCLGDTSAPNTDTDGVNVVPSPSGTKEIGYGQTYYWRVKVYDDQNKDSGWVTGPSFDTAQHAWPWPDFTHSPQNPDAEEQVTFTDESTCYDASNNSYDCENDVSNSYQWDFEDDGVIDSTQRGDVTHSYPSTGNYTARLKVADDMGTCDTTGDSPFNVTLPSPEWEEIPAD